MEVGLAPKKVNAFESLLFREVNRVLKVAINFARFVGVVEREHGQTLSSIRFYKLLLVPDDVA